MTKEIDAKDIVEVIKNTKKIILTESKSVSLSNLINQQPTADEIVKELSDITGCQWEYIYIDMYYYGFGRGKFPEVGLIHNEFKNYHSRGVNLAHKITTFFIQESESE